MGRIEHRRGVVLIASVAISAALLGACGSSGPAAQVTVPPTPVTTAAPAATAPVTTSVTVTDADVADLEKQLDEIDQLLSGVQSDLSQD